MKAPATYTVSEMASRISRTGALHDVERIARRLRNWTTHALLTPIGDRQEGTGRHRLYSQSELMKAALLHALARNFRVDVTGLQWFALVYSGRGEGFTELLIAGAMTNECYPIWMAFDNGEIVEIGHGTAPDILGLMNVYELVVVLDAGRIATRIFA
jgi:hypothetical protein